MICEPLTRASTALRRFWVWLALPENRMKNAADRRQSRQLAALLLLVLAGGLFLEVDHSLEQHGRALYLDLDSLVTFGALALLVVTFMLNRAGHLRIASRMTVVLIVLALFAGAVPTPTAEDVELLYYLAIPIVFSGVLLSVRFTAALGAVVVGGVGLFPVLVPGVPADTVPLTLTIIVAVLTVGAAAARARIDGLRRQELAESEARFRTQVEHAPQAILLLNLERRVWIEANQVAITLFRAPREQMLEGSVHAVPPFASASPDTKLMLDEAVREATTSGHSAFEASVYVPNGSNLTLEVRMVLLPGHAPALVLASFIDITEQRAAEARLRYLATHDTVTGLPNRALFDESLSAALERAERSNRGVAVCFLDLDNFKSINDAFSHSAGDEVLATIGARMRGAIRRSDMVARRGGDEFSLMIEQVRGVTDAELVMQKVEAALAPPVVVSGHEIYVTASIGVSLFPADAVTPELLLRSADTALFHAKARGKNTHAMYSEEMSLAAADQLWLSSELRHAIAQNGISVSYQPQVDPITGITRGVEALARWIHPARGRISPAEFIPVAEETGIITLLTEHVLDTGLAQLARWREAGIPVPRLGVNISTRDVMRADLAETITAALDRYGIPPESLELELTENIAFTSIESSRDRLLQLKRIGVRLAVDDFGTGYSTLHQLAHFPIDTLKLDQRLTPQIVSSANDRAVLAGVMEIASRIGFETVAEGVESEEQLHVFTEMGCTLIQGWYYSPALPAAEITSRLQAGPPVPDRPQPGQRGASVS